MRDNFFTGIRRGVPLRTFANGISITHNTWSATCGGVAAVELLGVPTNATSGNTVRDNTIECIDYTHAVKATYATLNTLGPNGLFDATAISSFYRFEVGATYNVVHDGLRVDTKPLISEDPTVYASNQAITSPPEPAHHLAAAVSVPQHREPERPGAEDAGHGRRRRVPPGERRGEPAVARGHLHDARVDGR